MFELTYNPCGLYSMDSRSQNTPNMPADFASYLLAASPPGFGFFTGPSPLYQGFNERAKKCDNELDCLAKSTVKSDQLTVCTGFTTVNNETEMDSLTKNFLDYCQVRDQPGDLDLLGSPAVRDDEIGSCGSSQVSSCVNSGSTTPRSRPESPKSPGGKGMKKRVSFADDLGLALENIRIMTEPSNTPPRLRPEIFQSLRNGAQAGVTEQPPLVLNFTQPASDYVDFRRRIANECVCLENVIIRDYNIMGTIKVKNIAFEKSVIVRCTFDGWKTHEDINASYVHTSSVSQFDTFSFTISVSTCLGAKNTMQFCVCYSSGQQEFWDNNHGSNYVVVTADWDESTSSSTATEETFREDNAVFTLGNGEDWTLFTSWAHRDSSVPYY